MAIKTDEVKNTTAKKSTTTRKTTKKVEKPIDEVKVKREYKDDELINVRNITSSELLFFGQRSGNTYRLYDKDDIFGVEVKDLNAMLGSRSQLLFRPYFIIEDEEFISQPRWKEIKDMYYEAKKADIIDLINQPLNVFKDGLKNMPYGYRSALIGEISSKIQNGTFDSLAKIRAVDEICGTELILLIG